MGSRLLNTAHPPRSATFVGSYRWGAGSGSGDRLRLKRKSCRGGFAPITGSSGLRAWSRRLGWCLGCVAASGWADWPVPAWTAMLQLDRVPAVGPSESAFKTVHPQLGGPTADSGSNWRESLQVGVWDRCGRRARLAPPPSASAPGAEPGVPGGHKPAARRVRRWSPG